MVSSTPRPHFTPRKDRYPFYRRLCGPQDRSGRAENLVPHRDSIPDRPARSQSLYRPRYPAHTSNVITVLSKALKSHVDNIRFILMLMLYGYKIRFLTFSQPRMRVTANRVVRIILGYRRENVARN